MTNTKTLIAILGASGHGTVFADLAEQLGYAVSFYDDSFTAQTALEHWNIVGPFSD